MATLAQVSERFESIKVKHFPWTLSAVGKFHLLVHTLSYRYKFLFHWLLGMGMTNREAPEWIWAILKGLGGSIQEMTLGHQYDIINNHHSNTNVQQIHSIGK